MSLHITSGEVETLTARAVDKGGVICLDLESSALSDARIFLTPKDAIRLMDSLALALKNIKWHEADYEESDPVVDRLRSLGATA